MAKQSEFAKILYRSLPKNAVDSDTVTKLESTLDEHTRDLARQGEILDWTFGFVIATFIVCFIAIAGFLIDAWRFHTSAYIDFKNTLDQMNNAKIKTPEPTASAIITTAPPAMPQ